MIVQWYVLMAAYLLYGFLVAVPVLKDLPEIKTVSWYRRYPKLFLCVLTLVWFHVCLLMYYVYRTQEFSELFGLKLLTNLRDGHE